MTPFIRAALLALALIFAPPAFAAAAVSTTVDLNPLLRAIIDSILPMAATIVAGALTLLFAKAAQAVGYNLDDARRARLQEIIENGVAYAASAVKGMTPNLSPIDVRSVIVAEAARYVAEHGAATIRKLGGDPANQEAIAEIVVARAAKAIDAAAPAP